jgi:hypothetical protein
LIGKKKTPNDHFLLLLKSLPPQSSCASNIANVTHANIERHAKQHRSAPVTEKETAFKNRNRTQNHIQNRLTRTSKNFFCTQRTSSTSSSKTHPAKRKLYLLILCVSCGVAGHRAWDPPDPVPNSAVKPRSVHGCSVVFGHANPRKLAAPLM